MHTGEYDLYQVIQVLLNNRVSIAQVGQWFVSSVAEQRSRYASCYPSTDDTERHKIYKDFQHALRERFYALRTEVLKGKQINIPFISPPLEGIGTNDGIETCFDSLPIEEIGQRVLTGAKRYHDNNMRRHYNPSYSKEYIAIMRALRGDLPASKTKSSE